MEALSELVGKAIGVVREALEGGDEKARLRAAMYVLKISGLEGHGKPGRARARVEMEREDVLMALEASIREMGLHPSAGDRLN